MASQENRAAKPGEDGNVEPPGPFGQPNADEVWKKRYEYAWSWFDLHAKQRMHLFYLFLVITGVLANAYVGAVKEDMFYVCKALALIGLVQALGFLSFDFRSRELIRHAEAVLEEFERHYFFRGHPDPAGILLTERDIKMREGDGRLRGWKNCSKMKFWIRLTELLVAIVFLVGLLSPVDSGVSLARGVAEATTMNKSGTKIPISLAPGDTDHNFGVGNSPKLEEEEIGSERGGE